jgi:hypothetical protein
MTWMTIQLYLHESRERKCTGKRTAQRNKVDGALLPSAQVLRNQQRYATSASTLSTPRIPQQPYMTSMLHNAVPSQACLLRPPLDGPRNIRPLAKDRFSRFEPLPPEIASIQQPPVPRARGATNHMTDMRLLKRLDKVVFIFAEGCANVPHVSGQQVQGKPNKCECA